MIDHWIEGFKIGFSWYGLGLGFGIGCISALISLGFHLLLVAIGLGRK